MVWTLERQLLSADQMCADDLRVGGGVWPSYNRRRFSLYVNKTARHRLTVACGDAYVYVSVTARCLCLTILHRQNFHLLQILHKSGVETVLAGERNELQIKNYTSTRHNFCRCNNRTLSLKTKPYKILAQLARLETLNAPHTVYVNVKLSIS